MRVYGRPAGQLNWVTVSTRPNGNNDAVYITALCQVLLLNLEESPFYANYGIPAVQSIITQIFPNYYAMQVQSQYSQYFAQLVITAMAGTTSPVYTVKITTHSGAVIALKVPE